MDIDPKITKALLDYGKQVPAEELFPTVIPEAKGFVTTDPYAFTMAVCLDRGTKAEIIWTIPYDIRQYLGHLTPQLIYQMSLDELADLFQQLPRRPRYVNAAPRTIKELTQIVVEEHGGNAENIWLGKRAVEVNRTFNSIYGVGPGIANMGVLLIEAAFGIRFDDLDRRRMDIKPDVHTKRVLYRLGVIQKEDDDLAIHATRLMNPAYPGALDAPLWSIGRRWCFASKPDCANCPIESCCEFLSFF
jgi:endonuclease III